MIPVTCPITHIGYVVDQIEPSVDWAISTLGAGPFFLISHLKFDTCTFNGQPAEYDHSSAFGQWGKIMVELTVVHGATPQTLADTIGVSPQRVGRFRVSFDSLEADSADLEAAGMPLFHTGSSGPVAAHWHDGRGLLGH